MKIALSLSGYFDSGKDKSSKGIDGFQYIFNELLNKFQENAAHLRNQGLRQSVT